ncbi:MAG: ribose 5-phosphate isomerase B [Planctomycetes bacterium]|nr:ribose 5-phosphate isomerase B [Planctomycetota bacterium]
MKIAIGSDHRGFQTKEKIKAMLTSKGYEVMDFGPDCAASCDYPDAAYPTCKSVVSGVSELGILLCGSGIGMSISANKVRGIRAALCHDELTAEMSRRHNDANVLCLPADLIGEELTRRIVEVWLKTGFEGGRHERRVKKIALYEEKELQCGHERPDTDAKG